MSNSFLFGNATLEDIYQNTGDDGQEDGYINIPLSAGGPNYNSLKPLDFHYYNNTSGSLKSLADNRQAKNATYTTSQNINIPIGSKLLRLITVSGGGGGGGAGGKAVGKAYNGQTKSEFGGNGGNGGWGVYNTDYATNNRITIPDGEKSVKITIGNGGAGGVYGNGNSTNSNYNAKNAKYSSNSTLGNPGSPGGMGNSSYIMFGNTGGSYGGAQANGGNGGGGANANANANASSANRGTDGSQGNALSGYSPNSDYGPLSPAGQPGNGGGYSGNTPLSGNSGGSGAVQIIWLFEP